MPTNSTAENKGLAGRVRVARAEGKARLLAAASFRQGEVLMELEGGVRSRPDRYSVQVGWDQHLAPPAWLEANPGADDTVYCWRFLNHSCRPNAVIEGRRLVALAPITAGDEITFNYNCTEFDMASPFECHCGHCGGVTVRGFRHLSPAAQQSLAPQLAGYLREALEPAALGAHA